LPKVALIAGPTASGKSALALDLAKATGGTIINADSAQVYRDLSILTARPSPEEVTQAPHRLFGHVDAADTGYSAARWAAEARAAIEDSVAAGSLPILVGGTGLYMRTLLDGSVASGDPSPSTAYGVFVGLKEAVRQRLGRDELTGLKVAIQGVGHVGLGLARHLKAAGAELWVADIFDANVKQAMEEVGANVVRPQDIYGLDVDVFAPCAMGGILNEQTLEVLRAPVIAGAANNQLASAEIGVELQRRNQLYAPDYAINAGGIIDVYYQRNGGSAAQIDAHVNAIAGTLREIFERAAASGECTSVIADRLAL